MAIGRDQVQIPWHSIERSCFAESRPSFVATVAKYTVQVLSCPRAPDQCIRIHNCYHIYQKAVSKKQIFMPHVTHLPHDASRLALKSKAWAKSSVTPMSILRWTDMFIRPLNWSAVIWTTSPWIDLRQNHRHGKAEVLATARTSAFWSSSWILYEREWLWGRCGKHLLFSVDSTKFSYYVSNSASLCLVFDTKSVIIHDRTVFLGMSMNRLQSNKAQGNYEKDQWPIRDRIKRASDKAQFGLLSEALFQSCRIFRSLSSRAWI